MSMKIPMAILAVLSIIGGYIGIPDAKDEIGKWLAHTFHHYSPPAPPLPSVRSGSPIVITLVVVAMGIFVAYRVYYRKQPALSSVGAPRPRFTGFFLNRWYIDELYDVAIVRPFILLALS